MKYIWANTTDFFQRNKYPKVKFRNTIHLCELMLILELYLYAPNIILNPSGYLYLHSTIMAVYWSIPMAIMGIDIYRTRKEGMINLYVVMRMFLWLIFLIITLLFLIHIGKLVLSRY